MPRRPGSSASAASAPDNRARTSAVDPHRHALGAGLEERGDVLVDEAVGQPNRAGQEVAEERGDADPRDRAGERRARTEMRSVAEAQMVGEIVAVEVERVTVPE